MWEYLQNVDWQSLITAIITSTTFQGVMIAVFYKLLKKIKISDTAAKIAAQKLVDTGTDLATKQADINSTITELKDATKQIIETDSELKEIYTEATKIIESKITLINELKELVEEYHKED